MPRLEACIAVVTFQILIRYGDPTVMKCPGKQVMVMCHNNLFTSCRTCVHACLFSSSAHKTRDNKLPYCHHHRVLRQGSENLLSCLQPFQLQLYFVSP